IELSDDMVPNGSALRGSVAGVVTDIVRDDVDGTRSYLIHCERSSGQYLWDTLFDAGAEYRLEGAGFGAGHALQVRRSRSPLLLLEQRRGRSGLDRPLLRCVYPQSVESATAKSASRRVSRAPITSPVS